MMALMVSSVCAQSSTRIFLSARNSPRKDLMALHAGHEELAISGWNGSRVSIVPIVCSASKARNQESAIQGEI
jgi:hypothetical protein